MNTDTSCDYVLINHEIGFYINLIRIKKHQKETNPELEYQLKLQKTNSMLLELIPTITNM